MHSLFLLQVHDIFHPFIQTSDDEITFITVNESKTGFCHLYKITSVLQRGTYNWTEGYTHSEGNISVKSARCWRTFVFDKLHVMKIITRLGFFGCLKSLFNWKSLKEKKRNTTSSLFLLLWFENNFFERSCFLKEGSLCSGLQGISAPQIQLNAELSSLPIPTQHHLPVMLSCTIPCSSEVESWNLLAFLFV